MSGARRDVTSHTPRRAFCQDRRLRLSRPRSVTKYRGIRNRGGPIRSPSVTRTRKERETVGAFVTEVPLRWSDMDAFGHVNHARTVTLLEEARVGLLFTEAERQGLTGMAEGMVVAKLAVDYHTPVDYKAGLVQVQMSVRELRAASFVIDYMVSAGGVTSVATAETLMVPYELAAERPRRLTEDEYSFLADWRLNPVLTDKEHGIA